VLAQTHDRFHVVIVDDASSDGSDELARAYAAADPERVTAIVKPANLGLAHSLVVGIGSGPVAPFAAFINDDDCWHSRKLERQLESFERNPGASLVFTDAELIDHAGEHPEHRRGVQSYPRYEYGDFDPGDLVRRRRTARCMS
jgi:glycosyltransferase involved in cell wall biosynthesis